MNILSYKELQKFMRMKLDHLSEQEFYRWVSLNEQGWVNCGDSHSSEDSKIYSGIDRAYLSSPLPAKRVMVVSFVLSNAYDFTDQIFLKP